MIQTAVATKPHFFKTLITGLLCLLFAGLGDLAVAQDMTKISKGPRRLVKKLAEDLAKDGLEVPYEEAMQIFEMLEPEHKELADLQAKTQKTLFKAKKKPKTKRLAKHQATCESIAGKIADLIEKYPHEEEKLAEAALALDHRCTVIHERLGHVQGKDGIWRTPRALELHQQWQSWGVERIKISNRDLEIEEKMAPNWARVSVGQEAKGFETSGIHICGKQRPSLLKERLASLVRSLLMVNFLATGDSKTTGMEIFHLCVGSSAKDYEKTLKTLQEHKLVTFGDLSQELQFKNGCFYGYGVDRLDKEKKWLDPVLTSALHDHWKVGIYPNWFSVGLSNYVRLMLDDVEKEVPEGPISRPAGLIKQVDIPISDLMKRRNLSNFETLTFTPTSEMSPLEIALSTSLVEFILLTEEDGMNFQVRYQEAVGKILEASTRPQSFEWEQTLDQALGRSFKEFEADWLSWLSAGEGKSLKSELALLEE